MFEWDGRAFLKSDTVFHFDFFTQKEGIAVDDKFIYISEEIEEKLSDAAFLYRIQR